MSHVLYTVNSRETLFDGKCDIEGVDREKSLDIARD